MDGLNHHDSLQQAEERVSKISLSIPNRRLISNNDFQS